MNRSQRRQFLEASLAETNSLLEQLSERRLVERMGLNARKREIVTELERLRRCGTSANVILSFDGDPVAGAPGIDADFAGEALREFQKFVSVVDAAKTTQVRDTGPIPRRESSRLRIVDTVLGSFGFELQEVDNPLFPSSMSDSVKSATRLLAAAGQGDDEFLNLAEVLAPRVQQTLGSFLNVVKSAHAVCKVVADDTEATLDAPRVDAAVERVTTINIEEVQERYSGKFGGARLKSMDFDHLINDIGGFIRGKVSKDIDAATVERWDRDWLGKPCVAIVIKRVVSKQNKSRETFTLIDLEPQRNET